jgi:hypothetical protein
MAEAQGTKVSLIGKGSGKGGQHLENKMVSFLWVFNLSFQVVKYLSKINTALLSLRDIVSGHQD